MNTSWFNPCLFLLISGIKSATLLTCRFLGGIIEKGKDLFIRFFILIRQRFKKDDGGMHCSIYLSCIINKLTYILFLQWWWEEQRRQLCAGGRLRLQTHRLPHHRQQPVVLWLEQVRSAGTGRHQVAGHSVQTAPAKVNQQVGYFLQYF